ncbi:hypothetical protein MRX96_050397, partial [Rhipicephalus microplus]
MYPDDEHCDYLFYTNVIASNGSIQAAKDPVGCYFKADIVILMGSQGWVSPQGACIATPPNAITSPELRYFDL